MIQISVESQAVKAKLAQLQHQTENLQPIFESIGQGLRTHIIDCFKQEKSPDGINWAALDPKTIRQRRNDSRKILNDTGRLKGSFAHVATNSHVEITTDTEYAPYHQFGTSKMVARPFFPSEILPQNWETEILEIINNHLQN
jgi:phage virion morphogenesis protein